MAGGLDTTISITISYSGRLVTVTKPEKSKFSRMVIYYVLVCAFNLSLLSRMAIGLGTAMPGVHSDTNNLSTMCMY